VRNLLLHLDHRTSMKTDRIHPKVLRELVEVIAKPLSTMYQCSWSTTEVPEDWRLASMTPVYKNRHKQNLENYKSVHHDFGGREVYGTDPLE